MHLSGEMEQSKGRGSKISRKASENLSKILIILVLRTSIPYTHPEIYNTP